MDTLWSWTEVLYLRNLIIYVLITRGTINAFPRFDVPAMLSKIV